MAFLDSDDSWFPEKLERVKLKVEMGNDLVCHGELWVKNGFPHRRVYYGPTSKSDYHSLLFGRNCISTSAVVVKRECLDLLGGFSEDSRFSMVEDYDLWLRLAKNGLKFEFINEVLGIYNLHSGNSSRNIYGQMRAELSVLNEHFSRLDHWSLVDRARFLRRIARVYVSYNLRRLG